MKVQNRSGRGGMGMAPGFSLMELMLVLAIIGVLMAVVVFSVGGMGERARIRATHIALRNIKSGVQTYNLNYSSNPPDLNTLVTIRPPILEDMSLKDGWGTDIVYDPRAAGDRTFTLGSAGPNKTVGDEDDIDVWTMDKKQ